MVISFLRNCRFPEKCHVAIRRDIQTIRGLFSHFQKRAHYYSGGGLGRNPECGKINRPFFLNASSPCAQTWEPSLRIHATPCAARRKTRTTRKTWRTGTQKEKIETVASHITPVLPGIFMLLLSTFIDAVIPCVRSFPISA